MTIIGSDTLTDLTASNVTTKSAIHLPGVDRQAGGNGVDRDVTFDVLQTILDVETFTATSHGRVSGDAGKPLVGADILDDTSAVQNFQQLLHSVVDSNTIRVVKRGSQVSIPSALLTGGSGYNISTSGRYVFWDLSANQYVATCPGDSAPHMRAILELISVSGATAIARVL